MEKICAKCEAELPATADFFYRKTATKDGLQRWCKACVEKHKRIYDKTTHGRQVQKQYMKTYRQTEKSQLRCKQYQAEYRQTERGKNSSTKRTKKYYATVKGHLHSIFSAMVQRCTKLNNPNYKWYGGRGIKICFESADDFVNYVVNDLRVDPRNLTIDRIDSNGNYEPGNIRFVTQAENNKNRRCSMRSRLTSKQIEAYVLTSGEWEGLSANEAATKMSITPQSLNRLLRRAEEKCPELFPTLTAQEADVKSLFAAGWSNTDIADELQVSLSRVSQIIGAINGKQGTTCMPPVKTIRYESWMDGQVKERF